MVLKPVGWLSSEGEVRSQKSNSKYSWKTLRDNSWGMGSVLYLLLRLLAEALRANLSLHGVRLGEMATLASVSPWWSSSGMPPLGTEESCSHSHEDQFWLPCPQFSLCLLCHSDKIPRGLRETPYSKHWLHATVFNLMKQCKQLRIQSHGLSSCKLFFDSSGSRSRPPAWHLRCHWLRYTTVLGLLQAPSHQSKASSFMLQSYFH